MPIHPEGSPNASAIEGAAVTLEDRKKAVRAAFLRELYQLQEVAFATEQTLAVDRLKRSRLEKDAALRRELSVPSELFNRIITALFDGQFSERDRHQLEVIALALQLKLHTLHSKYSEHFIAALREVGQVLNPEAVAKKRETLTQLLELPMLSLQLRPAESFLDFFAHAQVPSPLVTAQFIFDTSIPQTAAAVVEDQAPPALQELCGQFPQVLLRYVYQTRNARAVMAYTPRIEVYTESIPQLINQWKLAGTQPLSFEEAKKLLKPYFERYEVAVEQLLTALLSPSEEGREVRAYLARLLPALNSVLVSSALRLNSTNRLQGFYLRLISALQQHAFSETDLTCLYFLESTMAEVVEQDSSYGLTTCENLDQITVATVHAEQSEPIPDELYLEHCTQSLKFISSNTSTTSWEVSAATLPVLNFPFMMPIEVRVNKVGKNGLSIVFTFTEEFSILFVITKYNQTVSSSWSLLEPPNFNPELLLFYRFIQQQVLAVLESVVQQVRRELAERERRRKHNLRPPVQPVRKVGSVPGSHASRTGIKREIVEQAAADQLDVVASCAERSDSHIQQLECTELEIIEACEAGGIYDQSKQHDLIERVNQLTTDTQLFRAEHLTDETVLSEDERKVRINRKYRAIVCLNQEKSVKGKAVYTLVRIEHRSKVYIDKR